MLSTELEVYLKSILRYSRMAWEQSRTSYKVKLVVKLDAVLKFFKARSIPYALMEAVEKDLERLELLGVVTKVNYSDWMAPIISVPKPDGSVRICGDHKITINLILDVDHYPLPTPENLFATLPGLAVESSRN